MVKDFETVGYWSEVKLDILKDYAQAYFSILTAQKNPRLDHVYIDAFAGPGIHISAATNEYIHGSPLNALILDPPFRKYFFIDIDSKHTDKLRMFSGDRNDVSIFEGDCNEILLNEVFPEVRYEDYRRGLCLLDPYGLHLDWNVIEGAGKMRSMEIFLNFPVMDMNRNVLWRDPDKASAKQRERMTRFWGDMSWREIAYDRSLNLFGWEEKTDNETLANAFVRRLKEVAGYTFVATPMPMYNSNNAVIYYLIFASYNRLGHKIVEQIFSKYRKR